VTVRQVAARIAGRAWRDANRNGIQDAGEAGVGGAPINLLDDSGWAVQKLVCAGTPVECTASGPKVTTTTAPNGSYFFLVPLGKYQVRAIAPTGFTFSETHATGSTTTNDSDLVQDLEQPDPEHAAGTSVTVDLSASGAIADIDAGLAPIAVTITKDDTKAQASPGDSLTYTITVTNSHPFFVTTAQVVDTLPAQLLDASDSGNGELVADSLTGISSLTWPIATVPAGGELTFTVTATVDLAAAPGMSFTNTASVSGCSDASCTATDTDLIPAPFTPAHFILPLTGGVGLTDLRVTGITVISLALLILLALTSAQRNQSRCRLVARHALRH
jgi:uncharacterized repeat protein (TIGR01451 family)